MSFTFSPSSPITKGKNRDHKRGKGAVGYGRVKRVDRKDNKNETIIPTGGSKGDEAEKKENWHFKRDKTQAGEEEK